MHTLSYDEKPGIQAIATTSKDKAPVANAEKMSAILRDHEYKCLGTLSLLAAIDLLSGDAIPLVSNTHKSSDIVTFFKILDEKYLKGDKIGLILDNHSAHTSRETQEYLNTVACRFEFVFTLTHGSWLNMVEGFFSKMIRQMLSDIRVKSNAVPVPCKWKYRLDTIDLSEEDVGTIVYEVVNAKAASPENKGKRAPKSRTRKPKNQTDISPLNV